MKLTTRFVAGLLAIGLLTIGADGAFARGTMGGHFSAGNPGGLRYSSQYRVANTPANQAWETSNAWATYNAQGRQTSGTNSSTGAPR
jgi:hypothetical protein